MPTDITPFNINTPSTLATAGTGTGQTAIPLLRTDANRILVKAAPSNTDIVYVSTNNINGTPNTTASSMGFWPGEIGTFSKTVSHNSVSVYSPTAGQKVLIMAGEGQ